METFRDFLLTLDPFFILFFRLFDSPWAGFFSGIIALNLLCVLLGDISQILPRRLNRHVYGKYRDEMVKQHNLSVQALKSSNKEAYRAVNKQAHEAFGKYFFSQAGAFTLSIWPVPFALAWMELRFGGIPLTLPGIGNVFYPFFFLPMYVLVRLAYGKCMRRFPLYRRMLDWTRHGGDEEMVPFLELLQPSKPALTPPTKDQEQP